MVTRLIVRGTVLQTSVEFVDEADNVLGEDVLKEEIRGAVSAESFGAVGEAFAQVLAQKRLEIAQAVQDAAPPAKGRKSAPGRSPESVQETALPAAAKNGAAPEKVEA